ncbi:hypothetical protein J6590_059908 [Homalodisca vitripennis]|nr:hypothetical protein J6590_059908 [Homalodisca vitripennis]
MVRKSESHVYVRDALEIVLALASQLIMEQWKMSPTYFRGSLELACVGPTVCNSFRSSRESHQRLASTTGSGTVENHTDGRNSGNCTRCSVYNWFRSSRKSHRHGDSGDCRPPEHRWGVTELEDAISCLIVRNPATHAEVWKCKGLQQRQLWWATECGGVVVGWGDGRCGATPGRSARVFSTRLSCASCQCAM